MDLDASEKNSNGKAARWLFAALALILIWLEVSQVLNNYRIVGSYGRPDQIEIYDAICRLAIAHGLRIAIISTLIFGWRWSLWVVVLAYLVVYIPNPWVLGQFMNDVAMALFVIPLLVAANFYDQRLLFPWRSQDT